MALLRICLTADRFRKAMALRYGAVRIQPARLESALPLGARGCVHIVQSQAKESNPLLITSAEEDVVVWTKHIMLVLARSKSSTPRREGGVLRHSCTWRVTVCLVLNSPRDLGWIHVCTVRVPKQEVETRSSSDGGSLLARSKSSFITNLDSQVP